MDLAKLQTDSASSLQMKGGKSIGDGQTLVALQLISNQVRESLTTRLKPEGSWRTEIGEEIVGWMS